MRVSNKEDLLAGAVEESLPLLSVAELDAQVLPILTAALHLSHSLVFQFDVNGVPHGLAGSLLPHMGHYTQETFLADPVHPALRNVPARPRPVLSEHLLTTQTLVHSGAYQSFYRPRDIHYLAGLWLTDVPYGTAGMTGILLTRPASEPRFGKGDDALLRRIIVPLKAVLRRQQRIAQAAQVSPNAMIPSTDLRDTASQVARGVAVLSRIHGLSAAESRVLEKMAEGLSNQQIGKALFVSVSTVKTHVMRVMGKLGVSSRTQAALQVAGRLPGSDIR